MSAFNIQVVWVTAETFTKEFGGEGMAAHYDRANGKVGPRRGPCLRPAMVERFRNAPEAAMEQIVKDEIARSLIERIRLVHNLSGDDDYYCANN